MSENEVNILVREMCRNINVLNEDWYYNILINNNNFEKIFALLLNDYEIENMKFILNKLFSIPECKNWITGNYEKLISCTHQCFLPLILKKLDYIPEVNSLINGGFDKSYLSDIILSKFVGIDYKKLKDEDAIDFFRELFNEVMKVEKWQIKDIKFIAMGTTTTVWQVGKVVVKIGKNRYTPQIPLLTLHPSLILLPLLRTPIPRKIEEKSISNAYESEDPLCFVEVAPFVEAIPFITYDEKNKIHDMLKAEGVECFDLANYNLGLLPPNVCDVYKAFDIPILDAKSLGFIIKTYLNSRLISPNDYYSRNFKINSIIPTIIDSDCLEETNDYHKCPKSGSDVDVFELMD